MTDTTKRETCADKVRPAMESSREDIRELLEAAGNNDGRVTDPESDQEGCSIDEYGLAFDYVEPGTFEGQQEAYWRFQISYGGPSEEIRYYRSPRAWAPYRAEYWYLDWFDGANVDVTDDVTLAQDLWDWLEPAWSVERHEREGY